MADWCALPGSALALIARRLQLIEDFITFRSTCSSWLKATTLKDFDKSCPRRLPLLMLNKIEIDYDHEIDKNHKVDEVDENYEIHSSSYSDSYSYSYDRYIVDSDDSEITVNDDDENDGMEDIDEINKMDDMEKMDVIVQRKDYIENIIDRRILYSKRKFLSLIQGKADHETFPEATPKRHEGFLESDLECKTLGFPQRKDPQVNHKRKILSLSKGKTCNISLPEAKGMECIGSKGWLIMFERSTGKMRLFHLITRAQIPLPTAPPKVIDIRCAVLSASLTETSDYVVMVSYVEPPGHYVEPPGHYVGFWKSGNRTWTRIEIPSCVVDLNYYNGKFYALTETAQVWMCDVSGANPNNKASKITELPWKMSRPRAQLVECGGRLLIVAPFFCYPDDLEPQHDLKMVELDVIEGSYSIITSLGSSTVFLGRNQGFSIDANRFRGIVEPNLIYFGDGSSRVATRGHIHVPQPSLGWGRGMGLWINC